MVRALPDPAMPVTNFAIASPSGISTVRTGAAPPADTLSGMESGFGQQQRLGSTTSDRVSAQDGDPPATRRFGHLTLASSRTYSRPKEGACRSRIDAEMRLKQHRNIEVGGATLECTLYGSGPPVVLLANAGCSSGYFGDLARVLAAGGLQGISVNMRGTGESRGSLQYRAC